MSEQQNDKQPMSNATKATAVGGASGGAGTLLATWIGMEVERRAGMPGLGLAVAGVLGTGFAFVARWAAKLLPDG